MIVLTKSEIKTFVKLNKLKKDDFTTGDVYNLIPNRSQGALRRELQSLRDNGMLQFEGNGNYKKIGNVW